MSKRISNPDDQEKLESKLKESGFHVTEHNETGIKVSTNGRVTFGDVRESIGYEYHLFRETIDSDSIIVSGI